MHLASQLGVAPFSPTRTNTKPMTALNSHISSIPIRIGIEASLNSS